MHNSGSTISIVVDSGKGLLQSVFMPWNVASLVALAGLLQVLLCQWGIERDWAVYLCGPPVASKDPNGTGGERKSCQIFIGEQAGRDMQCLASWQHFFILFLLLSWIRLALKTSESATRRDWIYGKCDSHKVDFKPFGSCMGTLPRSVMLHTAPMDLNFIPSSLGSKWTRHMTWQWWWQVVSDIWSQTSYSQICNSEQRGGLKSFSFEVFFLDRLWTVCHLRMKISPIICDIFNVTCFLYGSKILHLSPVRYGPQAAGVAWATRASHRCCHRDGDRDGRKATAVAQVAGIAQVPRIPNGSRSDLEWNLPTQNRSTVETDIVWCGHLKKVHFSSRLCAFRSLLICRL